MRQIKFRAWDKEYRHMYQNAYPFEHLVYVEMFVADETFQQFKHKMQVINGKYFYFIIAKDIELMQFTGLQDRNGKDIYEGDILRLESSYHKTYEVYWDDDSWGLRHGNEDYDNDDYYRGDIINNWHEWEVVGNIYENPDLLKRR